MKTIEYTPRWAPPRCKYDGSDTWSIELHENAAGFFCVSFHHSHPGGEFGGAAGCGSRNMTQRFDSEKEALVYIESL